MSCIAQTTPAEWASNPDRRDAKRLGLDASFPLKKNPRFQARGFFVRLEKSPPKSGLESQIFKIIPANGSLL